MKQLGDSHNFGKYVYQIDNYIYKPRTVFWEEMFLSKKSKIRILISDFFDKNCMANCFNLAPNLEFNITDDMTSKVEALALEELTVDFFLTSQQFAEIGCLFATIFWFGIGDLHIDNVAFGKDEKNHLVAFPIDIETIFNQVANINQTLLIPGDIVPLTKSGIGKMWSFLEIGTESDKINLILAFLSTINFLNSSAESIFNTLISYPAVNKIPIRIIPRDTKKYMENINKKNYDLYFKSEKIQLDRNEVPYFFRYLDSSEIFYYDSALTISKSDFRNEDFKLSSPICLSEGCMPDFTKIKTAILSIQSIAKLFDFSIVYEQMERIEIVGKFHKILIYEDNYEIKYSIN